MTLWQTLLDPFGYQFFVMGWSPPSWPARCAGLIGVYVTLRGMSYIGHGLSHAIFGGYALRRCSASRWCSVPEPGGTRPRWPSTP
jgi:manganese/iron transport system permease protein/iron/zinc/copper transport system permease protein